MLNRLFLFLLKIIASFFLLTIAWVYLYKHVPVPFTTTMIANSVKNIEGEGGVTWSKKWKPLSEISPNIVKAVIASEDQKFQDHSGFDMDAIKKALEYNKENKDKIRGGSTISQQTAKNAFLWQGRSWLRKGLEVYFTTLIEWVWSKDRILEVYLNIAETGNGVYGVEAASLKYFKKNAKDINASEAALIAAILPSPKTYSATNPGPYLRKRQRWILQQMKTVHWKIES